MNNLDRFVHQMMASARLVQNKDVSAATAVIQQALAQAGLAPAQPHSDAGAAQAQAQEPQAFVDLNPAPGWTVPQSPRFVRPAPAANEPGARLPGRFIGGSHRCQAGERRYKLYIPAAAMAAGAARPLVVMLHGCTQNPDDFAAGTGMNALAEEFGVLVLYPEQDARANHNRCWNWFEPAHQARGAGEAELIASMTRAVGAEHGADPARVFVAGLSAGGAMAAILGAAYPELYAAVGVHSGLAAGSARDMISGLKAMKQPGRAHSLHEAVPLIVFHGDADHVVHSSNGDAVLKQYVNAHVAGQSAPAQVRRTEHAEGGRRCTRTSWHDAGGRTLAVHWIVHGAGHAWSGGRAAGSHTDPLGPCASREMLGFFLGQGGSARPSP